MSALIKYMNCCLRDLLLIELQMAKGDNRIILAVIEEYWCIPREFSSETTFQSTLKLPAFIADKGHCNQKRSLPSYVQRVAL